MKIKMHRLTHDKGAKKYCRGLLWNRRLPLFQRISTFLWKVFSGNWLKPSDFPNSQFLSLDTVTLTTHMGTHVDAPIHYGPLCEGKEARSIDDLPLEWFFAEAVRLDLRHKKIGNNITAKDLEEALAAIPYTLKANVIVLIWTGTDKKWGTPSYFREAPGLDRSAVEWLVKQGIKIVGIDTYGMDRPFDIMVAEFLKTRDPNILWPAHFFGRESEYVHLERLANLELLPSCGFKVSCFPIKLKGLDASWVRAVALIDEE
ncbi:MAG: cyclase [Verrucomicrobia bacterium RIFCSPHIGHO2_12_FULL_41_10]|nr:MAG: cyclase [Verrucomicrobia bacterium RIFCSPHIGHO2_12_FULL_41_10]